MNIKDPWIKTELSKHLSRINLVYEIGVEKRENVFMFCPKCLKLSSFNKIYHQDMLTGEEPIIYECNECKKKFVEDAWNPNNSIEKLITINNLIAPYQTDIQIMEFKENE